MKINVLLDEPTSKKLVDLAVQERRSISSQGEILIMHALGTWQPDHVTAGQHAKSKYPKQKQKGGAMANE